MVIRESNGARIVAELVEPKRLGVADEHAQDAPSSREVADRSMCLRIDASREKTLQPLARAIDDPESGVPCARELSRGLHELLEERVQRKL